MRCYGWRVKWRQAEVETNVASSPIAALSLLSGRLALWDGDGSFRILDRDWKVSRAARHPFRQLTSFAPVPSAILLVFECDNKPCVLTCAFDVWVFNDSEFVAQLPPPELAQASTNWRSHEHPGLRACVATSDPRGRVYLTGLLDGAVGSKELWVREPDGLWSCASADAPESVGGELGWDEATSRLVYRPARYVSQASDSEAKRTYEWDGATWHDVGKSRPKNTVTGAWCRTDPVSGRMILQYDGVMTYAGNGQFVSDSKTQGFVGNFDAPEPAVIMPDGTILYFRAHPSGGVHQLGHHAYIHAAPNHSEPAPKPRKRTSRPKAIPASKALSEYVSGTEGLCILEALWQKKRVPKPKIATWLRNEGRKLVQELPVDIDDYTDKDLLRWYYDRHGHQVHPALEAFLLSTRVTPEMLSGLTPKPMSDKMRKYLAPFWDGEGDEVGY